MININNLLNGCVKKKRFTNYNTVSKLANKYDQVIYFCNICNGYHLTSNKKKWKYKINT